MTVFLSCELPSHISLWPSPVQVPQPSPGLLEFWYSPSSSRTPLCAHLSLFHVRNFEKNLALATAIEILNHPPVV